MVDITREEIKAQIAQSAAETDTKFAQMSGKLDLIVASQNELRDQLRETRADVKGLRTTILQTGITSGFAVLGIMLAVFAVVLAVQANMLSAFQARTVPIATTSLQ